MTNSRFKELLAGPLYHPLTIFQLTNLAEALRAVVDATGEAGDKALEDFCRDRWKLGPQ